MSSNYGNESIRSLTDKEAMRKHPSVNLGYGDEQGAFHTLKEIVGNSMDEVKAGFGEVVKVTKHKDGSYSVEDKGRGVPLDFNERENKYNYELVFMTLSAGGKYNTEEEGTFEFSVGIFGLGASSSALTSEYFDVVSVRDGYEYNFKMSKGDFLSFDKEKTSSKETGTYIKWKPDLEVFTGIDIPIEWIKEYLKEQAIVNKGTRMVIIDESTNSEEVFYYKEGIKDYIQEVTNSSQLTSLQYYEIDAKGRDREDMPEYRARFQVGFTFTNENNMFDSYHNSSFLSEGGSPKDAVKSSFAYSVHRYITDNNLYKKKEKRVTWDDIEDSISIITNTYSMKTSYKGQTKHAITNEFIRDYMNIWLREQLEIYFTENPEEAKKIAEQVLINKRSSEKAEASRTKIRKELQARQSVGGLQVEGLEDCDIKNSELEERELLICEGLSAAQTITNARDDRTMGTIALRGRFISSLKSTVERVMNNGEAKAIIKALGCGIEIPADEKKKYKGIEPFNIDGLRYGKIIIATDSDDIGRGISLALISFFYKFMPELIKQNRIYISLSPRYRFTMRNSEEFAYDEQERDEIIEKLDNKNIKYDINIVKGLGELNQDVYWDYVLNPETRLIERLIYNEEDHEEMAHYFEVFMGEDIEGRKEFIHENISTVSLEDVLD